MTLQPDSVAPTAINGHPTEVDPPVSEATAPTTLEVVRRVVREPAPWRLLKMWHPGESLQEAATVRLIGVNEGHSILVTVPEESAEEFHEGQLLSFRGFSGECIYEFSAALLKVCSEPFEYLHVGWPLERQVERRERRTAPRVKSELPCMVYPGANNSGRFAKGTITDLSTGGAAIMLADELSIFYDEITVVFRLTVAGEEVLVEARARPVRKPEESGEKLMGVSFSKLGATEKLALHAFVSAALVRELEVPLYAN